jgi:hypothetical protein
MLTTRDRPTNFPSKVSTLTDHKTDVIIACFGFGESFAGEAGLADFKNDLNALIAAYSGKTYNGESQGSPRLGFSSWLRGFGEAHARTGKKER